MNNSPVLVCSRIRVHAVPGRTDGFVAGMQALLKTLSAQSDAFSYAEIHLTADESVRDYFIMDGEHPQIDAEALAAAKEIDLQMNLSCEDNRIADALSAVLSLLSDGSLADCARFCMLATGGNSAALTLSGMRNGFFHHGEVPFTDELPADLCWNSSDHRASFTFPEEALDEVWELSEILQERIDEIDLEFSFDGGELQIHSVQLPDREAIEAYRAALAQMASLADSVCISGALTPESDEAFALLRFVHEVGCVKVQTAIADI